MDVVEKGGYLLLVALDEDARAGKAPRVLSKACTRCRGVGIDSNNFLAELLTRCPRGAQQQHGRKAYLQFTS